MLSEICIYRLFKYINNNGGRKMWFDGPDVFEVGVIIIVVAAFCIYWITHSDLV